jgi:hypothetical protein
MLSVNGIFGRRTAPMAIASLMLSLAHAEPPPVITLAEEAPKTIAQAPASEVDSVSPGLMLLKGVSNPNFRQFARTRVGVPAAPKLLTLRFNAATSLTEISATHDFEVSGGSCAEGHSYAAGDACTVEVTFMPLGPGNRTGQVSLAYTAAETPFLVPLGGSAYGPAVSFIPSRMATVPGTFVGTGSTAGGLLSNPQGLAVDGGDSLYIADTGNNVIRFLDSSGVISVLVGGGSTSAVGYSGFGSGIKLTGPRGVAVDSSGTFYISDTGDSVVLVRYIDGIINTRIGGGATRSSCSYASPCLPYNVMITAPYGIATDSSGNVYTTLQVGGSLPGFYLAENEAANNNYYLLNSTAYNYYTTSSAIGADPNGNLFYTYLDPGGPLLSPTPLCYILGQNLAYSRSTAGQSFWPVAGSGKCGFSGDGGRATGAEISTNIGQFAWDAAGNFYFTDTGNNRIRRVDAITGVIHTLAGNGAGNGYGGDGGPSTSATIQSPTGLAVDSNGRVYAAATGADAAHPGNSAKADVRMFGTAGQLAFSTQAPASHSAPKLELISNVGNDTLNFAHVGFSSGNTADFAIDPNSTTCNFTVPLLSGHNCTVGFIFSPTTAGSRSAVFTLLDDTVSGTQTINMSGTGGSPAQAVLSPTSHAFTTRAAGTSTTLTLTLSNPGGATLTINSYTFTGSTPADFTQTHTCGATLAAGATCAITVTYQPKAAGARSATLTVSTSIRAVTATFTGTATAAAIQQPRTIVPPGTILPPRSEPVPADGIN